MNLIEKAEAFAREKHDGQFRKDGTPYINHPLRVADILRKYKQSHKINELVAAALLHDTIEDTNTSIQELRENFGNLVTALVIELTSDKKICKNMGKTNYLSKKLSNRLNSWALVIKLADRLDNVSDLKNADKKFSIKYKKETEEILKYIEKNRELTETQKRMVVDMRMKLGEYDF